MCGITGYWGLNYTKPDATDLLHRMTNCIAHRGPDGDGYWQEDGVGLGHRRLSIIDLEGGNQPMIWGKYVLAFNGEIYNYQNLKTELEQKGYGFNTNSDTEVIPALLEAYGPAQGLNRLRGMFAFALYNTEDKTLILARDYVGIKPLYFSEINKGEYIFSSEQKSLLASGLLNKYVNHTGLFDFFITGLTFSTNPFWSEIRELPPGTWAILNQNGIAIKKFWQWKFEQQKQQKTQPLDRLDATLKESARHHLVSDVPVASFLAVGVDSSILVALISKHFLPDLRTFTVGFDEAAYNEAPYAQMVAERYSTRHHEITMASQGGSPELFQKILMQYDQPFGDSSCLPTYQICREMSKHSKVVISGDGGDEMFGGYERYSRIGKLAVLGNIPLANSLLYQLGSVLSYFQPERGRQLKKAGQIVGQSPDNLIMDTLTYFPLTEFADIFRKDFLDHALGNYRCSLLDYIPENGLNSTEKLIQTEIEALLHADYLKKVDIASMAHALEVRTPFLDKEVFKFSASLPVNQKIYKGETKYLLKKLAEKYLPREIIYRSKQGFGIPFDKWVANPSMQTFIRETLLSEKARISTFIQRKYLEHLHHCFEKGQAIKAGISRYQLYQRIFMLLSLELTLNHWKADV